MRWRLAWLFVVVVTAIALVGYRVSAAHDEGIRITLVAVDDWSEVEDVNGDTKIKRPSPGNKRKFKATITPEGSKFKVRFRLLGMSKEKGSNLNTGDSADFDAVFEQQEGFDAPNRDGQEIVESAGDDNTATVIVTSKDYGPVGGIVAEIVVKPDLIEKSKAVSIINDKDLNGCDDAWDEKWPGPGVSAGGSVDDEKMPKLGNKDGDGFSRYEEYRGFTVEGKFRTLDPKTKDWFYIDVDAIGRDELMKKDVFGGLNVIKLAKTEASDKFVVNFNRGRASEGEMKATPITNSDQTGGSWGHTRTGGSVGTGGPNNVKFCRIWVEKHNREDRLTRDVRAGQRWLPIANNSNSIWRGDGKVKIDDEVISYEVVQNFENTFYEYTIVLGTKEVLLAKGPTLFSDVVMVLKEGEGEELARVTGTFNAQGVSKLAEDINAEVTEFKVADAGEFAYNPLTNAYLVIGDEAMSLTKVDQRANKVTVVRGRLGTTAAAHKKDDPVQLPRTFKFDKRALYGTREIALARGDKALIATSLIGVTRGIDGTRAAAHSVDTKFPLFPGEDAVKAAIAHTFAHEATHTLQPILKKSDPLGGHLRDTDEKTIAQRVPEKFRFLMDDGQAPGSWLTNGIATTHSPKTFEDLVLK